MLRLIDLANLADQHRAALAHPVAPIRVAGRIHDLDANPAIMGVVNLSRDSTYRDSIAVSTSSAVRRGRVMSAQGADFIDVGAESSTLRAARVGPDEQIGALVPVIEQLSAAGVVVSTESYHLPVLRACLRAGAAVVNLTGAADLPRIYELAAEHDAAVVMCLVAGGNVRDVGEVDLGGDPVPGMLEYFGRRLAQARAHGVSSIVIDPGMGFYYGNLTDPLVRARHQARVLVNSFRLRELGVPVCQAMPHAFDLFEEHFRQAEGFFAGLAALGGTHVYRTHEVGHVRAVLNAVAGLDVAGWLPGRPAASQAS